MAQKVFTKLILKLKLKYAERHIRIVFKLSAKHLGSNLISVRCYRTSISASKHHVSLYLSL